jgi:hypothetical protein
MTDGGRLYEFQLSTNMRQQQFDFWNAACSYLRNSWVTSLTDSSQSLARSAKILCSGSKTMVINMGIHFEDLAIDVQRFLTLVCLSRILPLLLATLRAIAHCPETFCDPVPYLVERVQCRVQGEYLVDTGDTIFVENGMESNYGVWIWLGEIRSNFRRKLGYRNFQFRMSKRIHGNSAETSGINFRVPRKFQEIADRKKFLRSMHGMPRKLEIP